MLTMFLGGLWHGAAVTFGIWGIYHGVMLCVHRLLTAVKKKNHVCLESSLWKHSIKVVLMFQLTCLGWLIFRADSVGQLKDMVNSLFFNFGSYSQKAPYLACQILFYSWMLLLVQAVQKRRNNLFPFMESRGLWPWVVYVLMYYMLLFWGEFGGQEFIYFQF